MPLNAITPLASRGPPLTAPACVRTTRSSQAAVVLVKPCMLTSPGQSHAEFGLHGSRRPPENGLLTMRICDCAAQQDLILRSPPKRASRRMATAKPLATPRSYRLSCLLDLDILPIDC